MSRDKTVEEVALAAAKMCCRPDARAMSPAQMRAAVEVVVWDHVARMLAREAGRRAQRAMIRS